LFHNEYYSYDIQKGLLLLPRLVDREWRGEGWGQWGLAILAARGDPTYLVFFFFSKTMSATGEQKHVL
jgi:hypothetical protein